MDYLDCPLDYYLDQVKESEELETIQEFDADTLLKIGTFAAGIGSLVVIGKLISFLLAASSLKRSIKVDPKYTKRLNDILSEKRWHVHIYPDPNPNAFAIGGDNVFMTTGLKKILTPREIEAILLHEAFHNKDLHIWKKVAYESAFTYLIAFVSITTIVATGGLPFLGFLIGFLMKNLSNIAYARIVGRRHEIKADEYAVKYGYANELASSLTKLENLMRKMQSKYICNKVCQFERKISEAIDEHPPFKKRVEIILKKAEELDKAMSGGVKALSKFVLGVFKNNG